MKPVFVLLALTLLGGAADAELRQYGPLSVDFSQSKTMNGAIIRRATNSKDQILFVGAYCDKGLFNYTGAEYKWKTWNKPATADEKQLVADLCSRSPQSINPQ